MKNYDRVAIFCFYNRYGIIYSDTVARIKDLKKSVSYLIVVVNGLVQKRQILENIADFVIVRENKGYDAYAYQCALFHPDCRKKIEHCDTLVLCNDTFFGPFMHFKDIISAMEDENVDFWGISLFDNGLIKHIQSYFLVIHNRIIRDGILYHYFEKYIPKGAISYAEICHFLESKLYDYLCSKGYKYGVYSKESNNNIYVDLLDYLKIGVPIIKKKFFGQHYNESTFMNALAYIRDKYSYDINFFVNAVREQYGIQIDEEKMSGYLLKKIHVVERPYCIKAEEILRFLIGKSEFYLYGVGLYANYIFDIVLSENLAEFKGFILTETDSEYQTYKGYPVIPVTQSDGKNIIVAMSLVNSSEVEQILGRKENILYLWSYEKYADVSVGNCKR